MKVKARFRRIDWGRLGAACTSTKDQFTLRNEWSFAVRQSIRPLLLCAPMRVKAVSLFVLLSVVAILAAQGAAPQADTSSTVPPPSERNLQAGKLVYEQHCAACHGVNGDGNGPAAVWLFPKPRNFSAGLFKIQSTPAGSLPTDDDLLQTVTRGMAGSSMPSFTYLTDQQRRDVVQYVKHLTAEMDASGKRVNKFEEAAARGDSRKPVDVPPEPPATLQTLTRGKEMFTKL